MILKESHNKEIELLKKSFDDEKTKIKKQTNELKEILEINSNKKIQEDISKTLKNNKKKYN